MPEADFSDEHNAVASAEPLVSVNMITYNHASHIAQAIECVLQQKTTFPFELIIGEDCSTDNTREIVLGYQRQYPDIIRVIASDSNVGLFANALRVERASRGKYVAYCEGDDYWHDPRKLEIQVAFLENHPDFGLVYSGNLRRNMVWGGVEPNVDPEGLNDEEAYLEILARKRVVRPLTVLVRTDILARAVGANPECSDLRYTIYDVQRWLEISRLTKIKGLRECLATYNVWPNSVSNNSDIQVRLRSMRVMQDLVYHYLEKYPCPDVLRDEIVSFYSSRLLRIAFNAGDAETVDAEFRKLRQLKKPVPLKCRLYRLVSGCRRLHGLTLRIRSRNAEPACSNARR